jgi:hypothetical protein
VSVNTFLNQQILSFANFDRFFMRVGLIKMSASTLERLLEAASEEKIVEAGASAARETPRAIILSKNGKVTLATTLEYIQLLSDFANLFKYSESSTPNGKIIAMFHVFGPKGSLFYSSYVKTLLEAVGYYPKIKTSDHSIDFEIISGSESTSNF